MPSRALSLQALQTSDTVLMHPPEVCLQTWDVCTRRRHVRGRSGRTLAKTNSIRVHGTFHVVISKPMAFLAASSGSIFTAMG